MKKIIELTDEDALKIVKLIHPFYDVEFIGRFGIHGLNFEDAHRKYGDCSMKFKLSNWDHFDMYSYSEKFFIIQFHHNTMWFAEFDTNDDSSNYNKNHYLGYKKLEELGYEFPSEPQWT